MHKKLRELWNVFDVWMLTKIASNIYLSNWWLLLKNPFAWLIVITFLIILGIISIGQ
jgi:hypothetical protein